MGLLFDLHRVGVSPWAPWCFGCRERSPYCLEAAAAVDNTDHWHVGASAPGHRPSDTCAPHWWPVFRRTHPAGVRFAHRQPALAGMGPRGSDRPNG